MIIFTLDALADDSHRQHLIDRSKVTGLRNCDKRCFTEDKLSGCWCTWQPDYPAYYEACDGDAPIHATIGALKMISHASAPIQIWSTLPESQRDAVYFWFDDQCVSINRIEIRMRPISDDRPQEELFELWKNYYLSEPCGYQRSIEMVFSSHAPTIDMFRKAGIFVFDCNQRK